MNIKSLAILSLLCTLCACTPSQGTNTATPRVIAETPQEEVTASPTPAEQKAEEFLIVPGQSIGRVDQDSDRASLESHYGAEAVTEASVYIGEGMELPGLALFAGEPKKTIELAWSEEEPKKLLMIRVQGEESVWKTAEGVTLGTSLTELERINGKPFEFAGLGWDLGGWVIDWKGGKLAGLTARFGSGDGEKISEEDLTTIFGDTQVMSDDPGARRVNPKIEQITINF